MDRSSFNFVGSTNDFEKRQEFKAKLASKIEPPHPEELPAVDNTFNGVSPGGKLIHPSLGEGVLVEVRHDDNEVLINFGANGLIGLVLNQAKSFVHAPVKETSKGIAGNDDAFIGSEIQSRILAPQDRDFREVDLSKITSPDFAVTEKTFIPVGSRVWHPDLGVCTVFFVSESTNSLILENSSGKTDLVLSQVRSKLRQIDAANTNPDSIPLKPLVREPLAKQVEAYKARTEVSVVLPEVFKSWQRSQQFMFLTRNQNLSTEQSNDVFSVIDGLKPLFHNVSLTWQTQAETEAIILPGPETFSIKEESEVRPTILDNKNLWHPDFGECSAVSVDKTNNELILQTPIGLMPFVLDATLPKLAVVTSQAPEHSPKQLGVKTPVVKKAQVEDSLDNVVLPEAFKAWKTFDQYFYLTNSIKLSSEQANDVIDTFTGNLRVGRPVYSIVWTNDLPETNKRGEFKQQLLDKIEKASVEPVIPVVPVPVDSGIQRVVEEVIVTKKESVLKRVEIDLPNDFKNWNASGQYVFLTRTRHLTSNEANDILDIIGGKQPFNNKIQYEIIWSE